MIPFSGPVALIAFSHRLRSASSHYSNEDCGVFFLFYIQIAWFDVCFSQCHKPVVLSTGPHCRYTHWKQTVFYMEDVLVADVGDKVEGMIAVKKSRKNPRDLDIKISYNFKPKHSSRPLANTQFYRLR